MSIFSVVKRVASLESARVAVWIAIGGFAIMGGNLLLAAVLTADDFGRLTLVQALLSVGVGISTLGHMDLIVRREFGEDWRSLRSIAALTIVPAIAFGLMAHYFYHETLLASGTIVLGCAGGSVGLICASYDRADVRLNRAQAVSQLPFIVFAVGAVAIFIVQSKAWLLAVASLVGGYVLSAAVGLLVFAARRRSHAPPRLGSEEIDSRRNRWRKALTFTGIGATGLVFAQMERLIIPRALGLEELATFGVAATLIFGPYKLLQGGIGYALMPRLRTTSGHDDRMKLISKELTYALASSAVLAVGGVVAVPAAVKVLYSSKYPVTTGLILAMALVGTLAAVYTVLAASTKALGSKKHLLQYHFAGWVSVVVAIVGGYYLAKFGLVGITLGVAVGWAVRALTGGVIARSALNVYDVNERNAAIQASK